MLRKLALFLLGMCLLLVPQPSYASPTDNNACKSELAVCLGIEDQANTVINLQAKQIQDCNKAEHDIESKCSPTSSATLIILGVGAFVAGILIEGFLHH
jgi:hypothetical protein